ncbi:MAG: hypothetical protein J0M19_10455 [Sphingomonadales bacterium]|nr:hypothetical protein [Sphingomonadales bacterium]
MSPSTLLPIGLTPLAWLLPSSRTFAIALIAIVFAWLTVVIAVHINHGVRFRRLKLIHGFLFSFSPLQRTYQEGAAEPAHKQPVRDIRNTPSMEFVISKYTIDLDEGLDKDAFKALRKEVLSGDPEKQIEHVINRIHCFQLRVNRRMVWQSLPYMVLVAAGWGLVLDQADQLLGFTSQTRSDNPMLRAVALLFLGSYLGTLTVIIRAVTQFDLTATTFLKAGYHLLESCVAGLLLVAIFHLLPGQAAWSGWAVPITYPLLFAVGFVPDAGLRTLMSSIGASLERKPAEGEAEGWLAKVGGKLMRAVKLTDGRFASATKSISLDVIDGIDMFTRHRLSEAGIYEVQNLAVANPILLHVETPFGIYQTIDWVAQAQLCTVVGPERFLLLRQFNIRTIFDLERAVLSLKSTQPMRQILGSFLLMNTNTLREVESLSGSKMPSIPGSSGKPVNSDEFAEWVIGIARGAADCRMKKLVKPSAQPPGTNGPQFDGPTDYRVYAAALPSNTMVVASFDVETSGGSDKIEIVECSGELDATIKHMVRVIMDDLHVLRLRQVWECIARILGRDAATLDDSEDMFFGA